MDKLCLFLIIFISCASVQSFNGATLKHTNVKTNYIRGQSLHTDMESDYTQAQLPDTSMATSDTPAHRQDDLRVTNEDEPAISPRLWGKIQQYFNRYNTFEDRTVSTQSSDRTQISAEHHSIPEEGISRIGIYEYDPACTHSMVTLTCRTIPTHIPPSIKVLRVIAQETAIPDHIFREPSFANLSQLYLNGEGLSEFSESSFTGLNNLIKLALSGMRNLHGSSLQLAISSAGVLPRMKNFALNTGEMFESPFLRIGSTFLKKLVNNDIHCFNLSNVITEVKVKDLVAYALKFSNLAIVNFTGTFLIIDYSDHPYTPYTYISQYSLQKPLIKILDLSHVRTTNVTDSHSMSSVAYANTHASPSCNLTPRIFPELFLIEVWYFQDTLTSLTNYQGYCDLTNRDVFWKKVVVSGNYIVSLNMTLLLPQNNTLRHIDLSNNRMEYIGPRLMSSFYYIEQVILSSNELHHMEHLPEFENLLTNMTLLLYFDLANNKITRIPQRMFRSNTNLTTLILANNRLKSILFELDTLNTLHTLDIQGNEITILDDRALAKLQIRFESRQEKLIFKFAGNPIQCSCVSLNFVSWLVAIQKVTHEHIACDYGSDRVNVDTTAVRKCEFLCHRTLIICVSTVCSIIVVALILTTVVVIRRIMTHKKRRNIEMRLREVIAADNFMCFMAIAGNDEALVDRVVLQHLRRLLQGKFGIDRDLVCTGYRFKPGFPICEEAYRLVKKCQVFVAVVSESFMRSQYCMLELQEACKQNKPTIFILLGHVETDDMPPYMQEVFRRTSRAWINQNEEGYYYTVPSLIDLCDAIWDLAIADLLHKF